MEEPPDVGLINCGRASHVNAALQILLHIPEAVCMLEEDGHRRSCKSLICVTCSLHNLLASIKGKKCVAPTFFVRKYEGSIATLPQGRMTDTFESLLMVLKWLEEEDKKIAANERSASAAPVSSIPALFYGTRSLNVKCVSCGPHRAKQQFTCIELEEVTGSIATAIRHKSLEPSFMPCPSCSLSNANYTPSALAMPPYLVVRVDRCLVPPVDLRAADLGTDTYELSSCVVQEATNLQCIFTSIKPNGMPIQIIDTQVRQIAPATFLLKGIPKGSTVTLIYRKKKTGTVQHTQVRPPDAEPVCVKKLGTKYHVGACGSQARKVLEFPTTTDPAVLMAGVKRIRSIGTQSDPAVKVRNEDAANQNDLLDYEKVKVVWNVPCKKRKKGEDISTKPVNTVFQLWTGLNVQDFEALYNLLGGDDVVMKLKQKYRLDTPKKTSTKGSKISGKNRLLLFLVRLRKGLSLEVIAFLFNLSVGYAGEIFYVLTCHLYETLKGMSHHMFPTAAEQHKTKPKVMKPFPSLRIILDGVSMSIQTPSNFQMQGNTWSAYKHKNVVLFIVGVSCNGATIFCSDGMEGSMSDKVATLKSDLLDRLDEGDVVMTDKGFELESELEKVGCHIVKPPMKRRDRFFTKEEEKMTRAIAAARIYVEHAMADIKDNALLRGDIPLTMYPILSKLVYIAAYLRNFSPQRIHNVIFRASQDSTEGGGQPKSPEDLLFEG